MLQGTKIIIIDPQSEYEKLVELFSGQTINLSRDSDSIINPLDLMGHTYSDKRLSLMDLFPVMIGDMSEIQKSVIDKALTLTYERKGITYDKKTWRNKPPILGDLLSELERLSKKATMIEKETYRSLMNRLSLYVSGVFSFFNRQTNLNFSNSLVGFLMGHMPKQVKPVTMFLVLDYVYTVMKKNLERKILVVDEAWSLLKRTEESDYLFEIVKTSRKFNLGLLLITQDVEDLLSSKASAAILQNSAFKLLMRQEPAAINNIVNTFNLSTKEKEYLISASVGEGLLILENEHTELFCSASTTEHEVITTNPEELNAQNQNLLPDNSSNQNFENLSQSEQCNINIPCPKNPFHKSVNIDIDLYTNFFEKSKLSADEISFLLSHGYHISFHTPLEGGIQKPYVMKPGYRESSEHFFFWNAICVYLQNFTSHIRTYETVKPDIVFLAKGRKIAVEVETGLQFSKKKRIQHKVSLLNKNYDDWFFVVTNKAFLKKYSGYGKTVCRDTVKEQIRDYFL